MEPPYQPLPEPEPDPDCSPTLVVFNMADFMLTTWFIGAFFAFMGYYTSSACCLKPREPVLVATSVS